MTHNFKTALHSAAVCNLVALAGYFVAKYTLPEHVPSAVVIFLGVTDILTLVLAYRVKKEGELYGTTEYFAEYFIVNVIVASMIIGGLYAYAQDAFAGSFGIRASLIAAIAFFLAPAAYIHALGILAKMVYPAKVPDIRQAIVTTINNGVLNYYVNQTLSIINLRYMRDVKKAGSHSYVFELIGKSIEGNRLEGTIKYNIDDVKMAVPTIDLNDEAKSSICIDE